MSFSDAHRSTRAASTRFDFAGPLSPRASVENQSAISIHPPAGSNFATEENSRAGLVVWCNASITTIPSVSISVSSQVIHINTGENHVGKVNSLHFHVEFIKDLLVAIQRDHVAVINILGDRDREAVDVATQNRDVLRPVNGQQRDNGVRIDMVVERVPACSGSCGQFGSLTSDLVCSVDSPLVKLLVRPIRWHRPNSGNRCKSPFR